LIFAVLVVRCRPRRRYRLFQTESFFTFTFAVLLHLSNY